MRLLILLLIFYSACCVNTQAQTSLFIQNSRGDLKSYYLDATTFEKYKDEIKIDTARSFSAMFSYNIWVMQNDASTRTFHFGDTTGLLLGAARKRLKRVETQRAGEMRYELAKITTDSLRKHKIPFFTYPSMDVKQRYVLNIRAKMPCQPKDTSGMNSSEKRNFFYGEYEKWHKRILNDFPEVDSVNTWIWTMGYEWITINFYLENLNFDTTRFHKYNLHYLEKFYVRPRLFEVTIIEEQ